MNTIDQVTFLKNMNLQSALVLSGAHIQNTLQDSSPTSNSSSTPPSSTSYSTRKKRSRENNWSNDEKEELLKIVKNFEKIIDNKRTDNASVQIKNKAWADIAKRFSDAGYVRDTKRIREFYRRSKQEKSPKIKKLEVEEVVEFDDGNDAERNDAEEPTTSNRSRDASTEDGDDDDDYEPKRSRRGGQEKLPGHIKLNEVQINISLSEIENYDRSSVVECRKAQLHSLRVQQEINLLNCSKLEYEAKKMELKHKEELHELIMNGFKKAMETNNMEALDFLKKAGLPLY